MRDWKKLLDGIYDYIGRAVKPLADRVKAFDDRLTLVERREPPPTVTKEEIETLLNGLVEQSFSSLRAQLEEWKPKDGKDGADGANGVSVSPDDVIPAMLAHADVVLERIRTGLVESALEWLERNRPKDGTSVTLDDVLPSLMKEVGDRCANLERMLRDDIQNFLAENKPKDGERGADGASVTVEDVTPLIEERLAAGLVELRDLATNLINSMKPRDGVDGAKGDVGERGERGETGPQGERGETGPQGEPGLRGEKGDAGESVTGPVGPRGEKGDQGERGEKGADGKSVELAEVEGFFEKLFNGWALNFERRAHDLLQRVADKIPLPKDGKDGLGFDDLDVVQTSERDVTVRFARGDKIREFNIHFTHPIYRGVWDRTKTYEVGDVVTWSGSTWHAEKDTQVKPGEGNGDWKLMVKKGRDGKDGERGERGAPGPVGKPGETMYGGMGGA